MSCQAPITAYRPAIGGPVRFNSPKDGRAYMQIKLPCGACILCREEHARQWAVRITHEATQHAENSFITLTYSNENLPEHNSLRYEDLQKFWRRLRRQLRKRHGKAFKLRYYAVGEYGDKTQRPHYHACVFGYAFTENRIIIRESPTLLWTTEELREAWGYGHVSIGALTFETARYTASYVTKKLRSRQQYVRVDEETGELIPLEQPRSFCSLKPALSTGWLEKYGNQVYDHDRVVINGSPQKPPKYYDGWMKKQDEKKIEEIKEKRIVRANANKESESETRARAIIAHARATQKNTTI